MSKDALKHYTLDQCICREEQIALKAYKPAGSEPEHTHEFL